MLPRVLLFSHISLTPFFITTYEQSTYRPSVDIPSPCQWSEIFVGARLVLAVWSAVEILIYNSTINAAAEILGRGRSEF